MDILGSLIHPVDSCLFINLHDTLYKLEHRIRLGKSAKIVKFIRVAIILY